MNPDAKAQFNTDTNIDCAPYKLRDHITLIPNTGANIQSEFKWYIDLSLIHI